MINTGNASAPLDDFLQAPAFVRNTLVRPSARRRWVYSLVLFGALLLAIVGLIDVNMVLAGSRETATDTLLLGAGLAFLATAGTLLHRFALPAVFAMHVSPRGFAWRTLFGWHAIDWQDIEFVWIKPHAHFGAREVFMKAGAARVHFGWAEGDAAGVAGPLESVPSQQARSLLRTAVSHAGLTQQGAGVWVQRGIPTR
jgi:hypothetical protein